jgi:hypothetical protein
VRGFALRFVNDQSAVKERRLWFTRHSVSKGGLAHALGMKCQTF